jgi:pimeloyl-ACP methyl ester carboxylesterase
MGWNRRHAGSSFWSPLWPAWVLVVAALASAGLHGQAPAGSAPAQAFVTLDGVRLHYADWGGTGPWLVFLTPGGGSLDEQFGTLAPQFVDRFRVVGLTRRGQPPSDVPTGPYDTDTLVRDLIGFFDVLGARRVLLAGHSIAGAEMTRLAATHPARVDALVYLDAAIDYQASAALAREAGLEPHPDPAIAAIQRGAAVRRPEYGRVRAPALNIAVVFDGPIPARPEDPDSYKRFLRLAEARGVVEANIRQFERGVRRGQVLRLRDTTHGGFVSDPAQQRVFVPVMRRFLLAHGAQ